MLEAGQPEAAREVMAPFAESDDPRSQVLLAEIAAAQGRLTEAEARFRRALPADDTGRAAMGLGIAALARGQTSAAGPWLERALAANERLAAAWNALGVVRAQSGDTQGALEAWRKAVASDSSLGDAWFNLALGLEARGDRGGAVQALERYAPLAKGHDRVRTEALLARLRG
jgi:tetratricopeptide (TPR) repeat protein